MALRAALVSGVIVDDGLQRGEILRLVESGAGGFLTAFFDAAVNHERRARRSRARMARMTRFF